jgi:uncharacterized protein
MLRATSRLGARGAQQPKRARLCRSDISRLGRTWTRRATAGVRILATRPYSTSACAGGSSGAMNSLRLVALALSTLATLTACNGASTGRVSDPAAKGATPPPASEAAPAVSAVSAKAAKKLGTPQPKLPVGTIVLETPPRAPLTLQVEVASTDAQRQTGMMFREQMADDEGMLFVFPTERVNSFWMHNTLIPLDMLFIDSEWTVVGIVEQATPLTDDPRGVAKMSQYVLEVNGGFAARHGLGLNTQVRFTPPPGTNP